MPKVEDIEAIYISLEVDSKKSLFILLAADGTINRLGTGTVSNKENDLFIGRTLEPLLARLKSHLTDDMLNYLGGYDIPYDQGPLCKLSIGLQFSDGSSDGFGFTYGGRSEGPPREISDFVRAAASITESWYTGQKKIVQNNELQQRGKKPWWKKW